MPCNRIAHQPWVRTGGPLKDLVHEIDCTKAIAVHQAWTARPAEASLAEHAQQRGLELRADLAAGSPGVGERHALAALPAALAEAAPEHQECG